MALQQRVSDKRDGERPDGEPCRAPRTSTDGSTGAIMVVPGLLADASPLRRAADPRDPLGGTAVDAGISDALRRRRGGGAPLPDELSGTLGAHFGQDLSGVRVHADGESGQIAQSLQSTAFTHGTDVYFAPGAYRPGTEQGQRLIAHELGHVVAQHTGADPAGGGPLSVGHAGDPAEAAADRMADSAMAALRRSVAPPTGTAPAVDSVTDFVTDPVTGSVADAVTAPAAHPGAGALVRRTVTPLPAAHPLRRNPTLRRNLTLRRDPVVLGQHRAPQTQQTPQTPEKPKNTMDTGSGTFTGSKTKTTDVDQSISDRAGGFTGKRTETTDKSVTGTWNKGEVSQDVRNGLSTVTTKTSHDNLVGGEAWIKTISEASDSQLLAAFQARARAGAFAKGSGAKSYQRGQFGTGVSGSYDTMVGLDTGVSGSAKVDMSGLLPALEASISAYAKGGVGVDAEASAFARLWKLEFVATGKVSAFAGFEASATGRAFFNAKEGVGVQGSAKAFAGARGSASGSGSLKLGPAELMAMVSVEGKAGAWAGVAGKVAISLTGVEVSGSAEAFAGVTGSATGTGAFKFRGKTIVSATGTVTVAAGIGGKVKGGFSFVGGKLKIDLGAFAVKGIGGGFELKGELDVYELGNAICTTIWEQYSNYVNEVTEDAGYIPRDVLIDKDEAAKVEKQGYDAFIFDFRSYAAEKLSGKGATGLNRERVQKILTQRRGQLGMALTHVECDMGAVKAAKEAFGPLLRDIVIQAGTIRGWDAVTGSGIGAVREEHSRKTATDALRSALAAGAAQTRAGSGKTGPSHAPDYGAVNKVLAKDGPALIATFGIDKTGADAAIAALVEEVYADFWSHVVVRDGQLSSAKVDLAAISGADKQAEETKAAITRVGALADMQTDCAAYAAAQAKSAKKPIAKDKVAAIIAKYAASITGGKDSSVADRVITDMVLGGLGASIKTFVYSDGEVRAFEAADPAEVNRAYLADADSKRRTALYEKAKSDFAAYVAEKTKSGENGVKQGRVQKIVDAVVKEVGQANLGEADAALTLAAQGGLGSMVNFVEVKGGKVTMVVSQTKTKALKDEYVAQEQGRGRFLGEEEANERRYTIRKLVNAPARSYFAGLVSDPHGVPTLRELQEVVSDALGGRADVLTKADGRDYLAQLLTEISDGIATVTVDEAGKVVVRGWDMTRLMALRDKETSKAASANARATLLPPLRSYADKTAKGRPSMSGIEEAIASVIGSVTGLQGDDLDRMLEMTVMEAFGSSRIRAVTFSGGKIVKLSLAK